MPSVRTILLVSIAVIAVATAVSAKLAGNRGDSALLDQEAREFGFSNGQDYANFFALDRRQEIGSISAHDLDLLARVAKENPRFRPLVLDIAARANRGEAAELISKSIASAANDPDQRDSVNKVLATWEKLGFTAACRNLRKVMSDAD